MAALQEVNDEEHLEEGGEESHDEEDISARHKREVKELRGKIQALKKSFSKNDKKKKKEVTTEIVRLEEELQSRHEKELASEAPKQDEGGSHDNKGVISLNEGMQNLDVSQQEGEGDEKEQKPVRKSRAQKQREKKQRREQEREKRIADGVTLEENTKRFEERTKLLTILRPKGLNIKDIRPDGNCLYAAISDQLQLVYKCQVSVEELRQQCGDYIEGHPDDFVPFITDRNTGDACTPEYLSFYCHNVKHTSEWGGEIEIVALSHVHHMPITVYQSEAPPIVFSVEEYSGNKMIYLTYHKNEFSLGKHYNSVIPNLLEET